MRAHAAASVAVHAELQHSIPNYKVEDQRFLGSEGFSDRIQRGAREKVEHIYDISLGDLVDGVEMGLGIPVSEIKGMSRNRIGASGRSIAGYLGRKLGGLPFE